jgi:4-hydroxybenzoyl-CoA thioesterase
VRYSSGMKIITYTLRVEFGDCDPAGIVWFPNFFKWTDAASRHFFTQCGVPRWAELEKATGVLGTPLVETTSRFLKTASYGDTLHVRCSITQWREKSFVQHYSLVRLRPDGEEDTIMECDETRIFATRREDGKNGIKAVAVPADIRAMVERAD